MPMPKKKTLKKLMKKLVKVQAKKPITIQPTKVELKKAYALVTKDLFTRLVKAKDGERITVGAVGSLGSLSKNERKVKSGIVPLQKGGRTSPRKQLNTYVYYRLLFKPSRKLKEELNKPLVRKYSR